MAIKNLPVIGVVSKGVSGSKADAFTSNASDLATKGDVRDLRNEMELLRRDMFSMEQRLAIKLGTFIAMAIASTAALVKLP